MRETGRKRGLSGLGSGFRVHKVGIIEAIGLKAAASNLFSIRFPKVS